MRKAIVNVGILVIGVTAVVIACNSSNTADQTKPAKMTQAEMVKRGDYLVNAMGCDDCHSPKRMGPQGPEIIPELRFSGFTSTGKIPPVDTTEIKKGWTLFSPDFTSTVGMWGQSFAGNLTSDATGIGNWKEEQFLKAIREGKYKGLDGTRPLLPPMPWPMYKNLSDDDLKSIFAYLKTTKPVNNVVPAPVNFADLK
jgi:cytochrome c553